uniref:PPM-type phosphatase domain-containing protein n=1 Tax=Panagrellus redivivus TaxID=6233 RepID=A0A7E4W658_PANRE
MPHLDVDSDGDESIVPYGIKSPFHACSEVENVLVTRSRETKNGTVKMIAMINAFRNGGTLAKFISEGLMRHILNKPLLDDLTFDIIADADNAIELLIKTAFGNINSEYYDGVLASVVQARENLRQAADTEMTADCFEAMELADTKLTGGAVAVLVLMIRNRLYIANTGNSMAVVVKKFEDHQKDLYVQPVTAVHEKHMTAEAQRLQKLGVNYMKVVGPTRCFGDYFRAHGYKEDPNLKDADGRPVIVEPFVYKSELSPEKCFIMLLSPTLIQGIFLLEQRPAEYMSKVIIEELSQMEPHETLTQIVQHALNKVHDEVENKRQSKRMANVDSSMVVVLIPLQADLDKICSSPAPLHIKNQPSYNTVSAYPDFSDFFSDNLQMQDKRNTCPGRIESVKEMFKAKLLSSIDED